VSRTADEPGQTLNVDLCFVPASHLVDVKLPAVSGSSGQLVVERLKKTGQEPDYPGKVFANTELDYVEAVHAFVQASLPLFGSRKEAARGEEPSQRREIQQIRQEEEQLSIERRKTRKHRKMEDAAWRVTWQQHRSEKTSVGEMPNPKLRARWGTVKAQEELRKTLRNQHRRQSQQRQLEDQQWRLNRKRVREQLSLLPADMQFLISDRGIHFTADVFQQFAKEANFVHVVIARHRPQSNGIAERFVRTLKEWLAYKAWQSDKELLEFIQQFLLDYNDRPHQGLPIPGLSPNEYAKRVWTM